MKFEKNEVKVEFLIPPLESNQILIVLYNNYEVILRTLVDTTRDEITVDKQENLHNMFKNYKVKDGVVGF